MTMPRLKIHHRTEYRYERPVAFGEHRVMLRPRDGHDLRVLDNRLDIVPEPMRLRWIHDVFGNSVAIATFDERARKLTFVSEITVDHEPEEEFALTPDDPAYFYPFLYDGYEYPDLLQYVTPHYSDPNGELSAWARNFLDEEAPTPTFKILSGMTHGIRKAFKYRKRHEQGTQHPLDTLVESRDRHRIAEHVMDPAQRHRLGHDGKPAVEHAQVMAVARAQHDPVLAERHGAAVAIFGLVMNREQRHRQAIMVILDRLSYSFYCSILRAACFFHRQ